jgi:hypothetical protein
VALPPQPQGEGIAVDGSRLLVDSEGRGSALYAVPLPRVAAKSSPTPHPTATPEREQQDRDPFPIGIAAAALAVVGFLVVWLVRRRR